MLDRVDRDHRTWCQSTPFESEPFAVKLGGSSGEAQALDSTAQQLVAMPELGLESIRLAKHSVSGFDLTVQASRDLTLSQPQISSNGEELIISFLAHQLEEPRRSPVSLTFVVPAG